MDTRPFFAALAVAAALTGCTPREPDNPTPITTAAADPDSTTTRPGPPATGRVADMLRGLTVDNAPKRSGDKLRPPDETYNRARDWQPAPEWGRPDRNSCDTRERVLYRDAQPGTAAVGPQCRIFGTWPKVYVDGETDNSSMLQIDHVVSLADAWRSGGWQWFDRSAPTPELATAKMRAFTLDETNLRAVDGTENARKGDSGPADWQPPRAATGCEYATRYVSVKATWTLTVTSRDRDVAGRLLDTSPT